MNKAPKIGTEVTIWICLVCAILTIMMRIPVLELPFFGSHLFRQLQTLSTIEAYLIDGVHLLKPRTNYIGYPGHLLLEFPIFQAIAAVFTQLINRDPLLVTRCLNLCIGAFSTIWVYRISRTFMGAMASTAAAFIFFTAPLNLMYHASTLIDPFAVLATLIAVSCYLQSLAPARPSLLTTCLFTIAAVLTVLIKPLYLFPLALLILTDVALSRNKLITVKTILSFIQSRLCYWVPILVAGIILLIWLKISSTQSSAQDVTSHLGWQVLLKPSFYFTVAIRYLFFIQSPITILLGWLGVCWVLKKEKMVATSFIIFFTLPFTYYVAFANINRPHDYYSLILVPFVSMAAGAGIQKLTENMNCNSLFSRFGIFPVLVILFLGNIFLYFTNYWMSPNLRNRYSEFATASQGILEPYHYSLVFVDRKGPFELNEYLAESRRDMVAARLGRLNEKALRSNTLPIYEPAVLYALNHQYGEMLWYSGKLSASTIREKIETYEGHLSYVIVLMASNPAEVQKTLGKLTLVATAENMLVFKIPNPVPDA